MSGAPPTFEDVQSILFTIANAADENVRFGIYGRHDAKGRYSWESKVAFVASIASFPDSGDIPLFSPVDYTHMSDAEILTNCNFLQMISPQPGGAPAHMPIVRPGSGRRKANADELSKITAWIRTLDLSKP